MVDRNNRSPTAEEYEEGLYRILARMGFLPKSSPSNVNHQSKSDKTPESRPSKLKSDADGSTPFIARNIVPKQEFFKGYKEQPRPMKKGMNKDMRPALSDTEADAEIAIPDLKISIKGEMVFRACAPDRQPFNNPLGILVLKSGCILVADTGNNRLMQFSNTGIFLQQVKPDLQRPTAIVKLDNGGFAVKDDTGICLFSDSLKLLGRTKDCHHCFGLAVNDSGDLVTIKPKLNGHIEIITVDAETGSKVGAIDVNIGLPPAGVREFKPRFIDWQGNRRILILDVGQKCVYIVDTLTETVVSKFPDPRSNFFSAPTNIVCDTDGYILVADLKTNSIQVFDPYGKFLCPITMDVIAIGPAGVYLTRDSFLFVVTLRGNHFIKYCLEVSDESLSD